MILYHKQPNSLIYNYVELTLLTNGVNIEWNHYKENLRTKNPKHPLKGNVLAVIYKILHLCMCVCLICTCDASAYKRISRFQLMSRINPVFKVRIWL